MAKTQECGQATLGNRAETQQTNQQGQRKHKDYVHNRAEIGADNDRETRKRKVTK